MDKSFRLLENGIQVTCQSDVPLSFRIPLAVDPQVFYSASGTYLSSLLPGSWTWGVADGFQVEVHSDGNLVADGFTSAQPFLESGEDPDKDYPYMHYFPFPFSLVSVTGEGEVVVVIEGK